MTNANKPEVECIYCGNWTEPLAILEHEYKGTDYVCSDCFGTPDQGPDWTDLPQLNPIDPD